jgi:hypothetical protein
MMMMMMMIMMMRKIYNRNNHNCVCNKKKAHEHLHHVMALHLCIQLLLSLFEVTSSQNSVLL